MLQMLQLLLTFTLVLTIPLSTFAGPLSPHERNTRQTIDHVRMAYPQWNKMTDQQLLQMVIMLTKIEIEKLRRLPPTPATLRTLGDAHHDLGHHTEALQDFDAAIGYHKASLHYYRQSGMPAVGSWGDGVEHTHEHIFMNLYDKGVMLESKGLYEESIQSLRAAWAYFESADRIKVPRVLHDERFQSRYRELIARPDFDEVSFASGSIRSCRSLFSAGWTHPHRPR